MAFSPNSLAVKELETASVVATAPFPIGVAIGYDSAIVIPNKAIRGISKAAALKSGDCVAIVTEGEAVVQIGAAVPEMGMPLKANAAGQLVPASPTDSVIGRSITTATSAGQYIVVYITREK